MKTAEIRKIFLNYFANKEHQIVSSSPLVPINDATLLFTNAGMVQFKDVFLGDEQREYSRATTSQKCLRAGGKHNDLENVGYTARHHTFFEMLGNFSFGDYFKEEAIKFAWELLTQGYRIPAEKLLVTVYAEDDEAALIWKQKIGLPEEKIIRIATSDNFWQMGDTGPCGPCTEIFYDHGEEVLGGPPGSPEEDGDRFIEIWNLVFMQYNRDENGTLHPLPKPSVDTGMGLERIAAVLQGVHSNYEIDLFENLLHAVAKVTAAKDLSHHSLRVIADHIRSTSFLITDGVTPSNEGRGYVLRRIIRRAVRHGYQLGCKRAFMHELVPALVAEMGEAFPELVEQQEEIKSHLKRENEKFNETLEQGLSLLEQETKKLDSSEIPGSVVFKLYDTFGFPADLVADVARERGLSIDQEGFDELMQQQRERARAASQFSADKKIRVAEDIKTDFVGYFQLHAESEIRALVKEGESVNLLSSGDAGVIVLAQTPFYAESGGQAGDTGKICVEGGVFEVDDTQYIANNVIAHFGHVALGQVQCLQKARAEVTADKRVNSANNHSATHLLHAALKKILGQHVQQKGSLVNSDRLRFDFSHYEPINLMQRQKIEDEVNHHIRQNYDVSIEVMDLQEAKAAGAEALFGEKYSDQVRTIRMGDYSFELCGGTHVERTGNIGLFCIVSEAGVAAGVRRIEALTGQSAQNFVRQKMHLLNDSAAILKSRPEQLPTKIENLLQQQKELQQKIQSLQSQIVAGEGNAQQVRSVEGVKFMAFRQDGFDAKALRIAVDRCKKNIGSGVIVIAAVNDDKVTLLAGVTSDLTSQFQAGKIISELAPIVDGRGGGKSDFAQGGGDKVEAVDDLLASVEHWIKENKNF